MCQRLSHGKSHLVCVQRALKQDRQGVGSAEGLVLGGLHDFLKALAVMGLQLGDACGQARKGFAV